MAIQKSITLKTNLGSEVTFSNAYIKVRSVNVSKASAQANIDIHAECLGAVIDMRQIEFVALLEGANAIAQAYEHLKTLPEFAGATDC